MSAQSASFGEYLLLTRTNIEWSVKGRARVWEIDPLKERK